MTHATAAWTEIRSALQRQRARGLRIDQLSEITGIGRRYVATLIRERAGRGGAVERTGEKFGHAEYWRLVPESSESEETHVTTDTTDTTATETKLWGDIEIEVIGCSGEYQSGKTILVVTIDPQNTKLYDFEKSAGTYSSLGIKERIDVPQVLTAKFAGKEYRPLDVFRWWREDVLATPPGEFTVIATDPISDIEQGLVDYVASQYAAYGFSSEKAFTSTGGIFWSNVKAYWKTVLVDLATRCQTFAFTTHMRQVWSGGKPSSRREPKGKDTLMELASLYLLLDRKPDEKGKVPAKPNATVLKSRLAKFVDGEIVPVLPPRIKEATPKKIREYIAKPPDYSKLKKDELIPEEKLSDDEKLELQAQIAADQKAAAEAELQKSEMMIQAARRTAAARAKASAANATPDQSQQIVTQKEQDRAQEAAQAEQDAAGSDPPQEDGTKGTGAPAEPGGEAPPQATKATPVSSSQRPLEARRMQLERFRRSIMLDFDQLGATPAQREAILGKRGVKKIDDLEYDAAEGLAKGLQEKVRAKGGDPSIKNLILPGN